MQLIDYFWTWTINTTQAAVSWLNTAYNNATMHPFFSLLIVIFATMMITKYIIYPLLAGGSGKSDKAKKSNKSEESEE